jgi:uncharacterized membrane protein
MMWPYYGDGWSWLWMVGMMVVFWGAAIFLVVWVVTSIRRPQGADDDVMDTLRKRLAEGKITQEEFEKTKGLLQG